MVPRRAAIVAALVLSLVGAAPAGAGSEGEWSIVSSPNAVADQHNFLFDVACVSASDCWTVGYFWNGTAYRTLVERWDGDTWEIVPSPSSTGQINVLSAVACATATDCWAVGYYYTGSAYQPLILRWDGTTWEIVPAPNTSATRSDLLFGVTCVSASDCWAVGVYRVGVNGGGAPSQTLIERWDGTSWEIVPSPNTLPARANSLVAVTCTSESSCWAVGSHAAATADQTLIERWDGTSWEIVPSPNTTASRKNLFNDVTCVSATDCWAVGLHGTATAAEQTLTARWDGASWSIVPSPNNSDAQNNLLMGVACGSTSECWALGYHKPSNTLQTLIERWDGTSWEIVPSPNTSAGQTNTLFGVTCASALACWAVGNYYNATSTGRTLTVRYLGTPGPPSTSSPAPQITDRAGDANGLNAAGVEEDARPASYDPADLLTVRMETTYVAVPIGEDGIRHDPTGLAITIGTQAAPSMFEDRLALAYRLDTVIAGCRSYLEAAVLTDGTLVYWDQIHGPPAACPNPNSQGPTSVSNPEWTATIDPDARTIRLHFPFSSLSAKQAEYLKAGNTLEAPHGATLLLREVYNWNSATGTRVENPVLLDATLAGPGFVIGSDVPPDVPCTRGCP